jgi:hypothetical protein
MTGREIACLLRAGGEPEHGGGVVPADGAQPLLTQAQPHQAGDLLGVGVRDVREVAAQQDLPGQAQRLQPRQRPVRERGEPLEERRGCCPS